MQRDFNVTFVSAKLQGAVAMGVESDRKLALYNGKTDCQDRYFFFHRNVTVSETREGFCWTGREKDGMLTTFTGTLWNR